MLLVKVPRGAQDKNLRGFQNYAYWQSEATRLICTKLKNL